MTPTQMTVRMIDAYDETTPREDPIGAWNMATVQTSGAFWWPERSSGVRLGVARTHVGHSAVPWWEVVIEADAILELTVARVKALRAEVRAAVTGWRIAQASRNGDGSSLHMSLLLRQLRDWHRHLPTVLRVRSWVLSLERWVA